MAYITELTKMQDIEKQHKGHKWIYYQGADLSNDSSAVPSTYWEAYELGLVSLRQTRTDQTSIVRTHSGTLYSCAEYKYEAVRK